MGGEVQKGPGRGEAVGRWQSPAGVEVGRLQPSSESAPPYYVGRFHPPAGYELSAPGANQCPPGSAPPSYVGRFAPTPSGSLHFGSLYTALASYLDARAAGGRWLLRIEDVDRARSRESFIGDICRTLAALGLHWDGEIRRQSQHLDDYRAVLAELAPHCYHCDCSRRHWQPGAAVGPLGPVYPGHCRRLRKSAGALRLALPDEEIGFHDRLWGERRFALAQLGDPILRRRDGDMAYLLAVVVDDQLQGVNHIVRGRDLYAATPLQIQLQRLLGYAPPAYLHLPLILGPDGEKLSKSRAAPALNPDALRTALAAALQALGQPVLGDSCEEMLAAAVRHWQPARIPRVDLPRPAGVE